MNLNPFNSKSLFGFPLISPAIEKPLLVVTPEKTWYLPKVEIGSNDYHIHDSLLLLQANDLKVLREVNASIYEVKPKEGWDIILTNRKQTAIVFDNHKVSQFILWDLFNINGSRYFKKMSVLL